MRFTVSAAFLAFVASAFAQTDGFDALTTPIKDENLPAGKAYDVNWQPGTYTTGTVSLSLLGGATPATLQVLGSIASGVQNSAGTYSWGVNSTLGDLATYGIKITLDSDSTIFQYSFPFHITASETTSSSSSSSSGVVTSATGYPTSAVETSATTTYSVVETSTAGSGTVIVSDATTASTFATVTASASSNGTSGASTTSSTTTKSSSSTSSSAAGATSSTVTISGAGKTAAGSFALVAAIVAAFAM